MSEHIAMLVKKNSVMNPGPHGSSIIIITHESSTLRMLLKCRAEPGTGPLRKNADPRETPLD
jgi:hypothetical protein